MNAGRKAPPAVQKSAQPQTPPPWRPRKLCARRPLQHHHREVGPRLLERPRRARERWAGLRSRAQQHHHREARRRLLERRQKGANERAGLRSTRWNHREPRTAPREGPETA